MKVPKGGASRDNQQSTGNLEERSVLETDWRFISLNIHQLGLRKKSPNENSGKLEGNSGSILGSTTA